MKPAALPLPRKQRKPRMAEPRPDADCVAIMRQTASEKLGFNCTFVDADMAVLVHLAQRAVLAGLDSDFKPDMQRRFREASEPFRAEQEAALGRVIENPGTAKPQSEEPENAALARQVVGPETARDSGRRWGRK